MNCLYIVEIIFDYNIFYGTNNRRVSPACQYTVCVRACVHACVRACVRGAGVVEWVAGGGGGGGCVWDGGGGGLCGEGGVGGGVGGGGTGAQILVNKPHLIKLGDIANVFQYRSQKQQLTKYMVHFISE